MRKFIVILALAAGLASLGLVVTADIHDGKPTLNVPAVLTYFIRH
jgi:hypothetical protein